MNLTPANYSPYDIRIKDSISSSRRFNHTIRKIQGKTFVLWKLRYTFCFIELRGTPRLINKPHTWTELLFHFCPEEVDGHIMQGPNKGSSLEIILLRFKKAESRIKQFIPTSLKKVIGFWPRERGFPILQYKICMN